MDASQLFTYLIEFVCCGSARDALCLRQSLVIWVKNMLACTKLECMVEL